MDNRRRLRSLRPVRVSHTMLPPTTRMTLGLRVGTAGCRRYDFFFLATLNLLKGNAYCDCKLGKPTDLVDFGLCT